MIKCAIVTPTVSRLAGGMFESVRRLAQSISEQEVLVEVFACRDRYSDEDIKKWLPLRPHLFDSLPPRAFSFAPGFLSALSAMKPDIVSCHGIWMYPSVANLIHSCTKKLPYLISPHGCLDPWAVRNSRWKKALAEVLYEKVHLRKAVCLRALCRSEAESIREYGLKNPICVIPNGIDLVHRETFPPPPWEGLLEFGKRVLLFLGRIHPKKGLPNLLNAWSTLSTARRREWTLAVAGWDQGGHEVELQRLAIDLEIAGEVVFLGPRFGEEKAALYHHADAFVLPSYSEGLPMAVLEAWAFGLPVVMTPQCNLPEGFAVGAALEVAPDAASVARGLDLLTTMSGTELNKMGENGHRLVKTSFEWQKIASDVVKVFEWVLGGDKPEEIFC